MSAATTSSSELFFLNELERRSRFMESARAKTLNGETLLYETEEETNYESYHYDNCFSSFKNPTKLYQYVERIRKTAPVLFSVLFKREESNLTSSPCDRFEYSAVKAGTWTRGKIICPDGTQKDIPRYTPTSPSFISSSPSPSDIPLLNLDENALSASAVLYDSSDNEDSDEEREEIFIDDKWTFRSFDIDIPVEVYHHPFFVKVPHFILFLYSLVRGYGDKLEQFLVHTESTSILFDCFLRVIPEDDQYSCFNYLLALIDVSKDLLECKKEEKEEINELFQIMNKHRYTLDCPQEYSNWREYLEAGQALNNKKRRCE